MLKVVSRWLTRTPTLDLVDRRNAPFMQVLMILVGTLLPLNKALYLYVTHTGGTKTPSPLLPVDLATDVLIVLSAWAGVWLIRRGRFRTSVMQFLSVLLVCMAGAYAAIGMGLGNLSFDPIPLLVLAVAGLVMGRRMLWITLAALIAILLLCLCLSLLADPASGSATSTLTGKLISMSVIYVLVTILLDRTVAALRDALAESQAHREQLIHANARLEQEAIEHERSRGQLIHAKKMEAVGMLASGVAHDFGNVLSVVLGQAERREYIADRGIQALVNAMQDIEFAARRALAINRKLLNLGRQEIASPEVFDLRLALESSLPLVRQLFDADVSIELDNDQHAMPVLFDQGRFELLLLNIASNARDAMPEGGLFRIATRLSPDGRYAMLRLEDTGTGMSPDIQQQAFDVFFTTKPKGSGTGLGLSMVRDMVEEANGRIQIDPAYRAGCAIVMTLPLAGPLHNAS